MAKQFGIWWVMYDSTTGKCYWEFEATPTDESGMTEPVCAGKTAFKAYGKRDWNHWHSCKVPRDQNAQTISSGVYEVEVLGDGAKKFGPGQEGGARVGFKNVIPAEQFDASVGAHRSRVLEDAEATQAQLLA